MRSARANQSPSLLLAPQPVIRNEIGRGPNKLKQPALSWKASWIGKGVLASEFAEEEQMSMIVAGFGTRMRKRTADSEDEPAPTSDWKRPRRSSSNDGA